MIYSLRESMACWDIGSVRAAHVKCCSSSGSVRVRLRSEIICIAVDEPIGSLQASVQHWVCQTPHRRIVWMFACWSALVWPFLASWLFFLGLNCSWCHLEAFYTHFTALKLVHHEEDEMKKVRRIHWSLLQIWSQKLSIWVFQVFWRCAMSSYNEQTEV